MSKKTDEELLMHSICHLRTIKDVYMECGSYEKLKTNLIYYDSVLHNLTQVGEMANQFSEEFMNDHKNIPVRDIYGLRCAITHHYDKVESHDIYGVIKKDVPDLLNLYRNILVNEYGFSDEYILENVSHFRYTREYLFKSNVDRR
ncbi:MAG: DUF86 domain-containing protein [Bacilli bacterium]|nr:DUF86 domain-containing protein [Bacilli bacterium]